MTAVETSDLVPAGAVLAGRYVVEATIGAGAFGWVVRAHDRDQDRAVALKILRPERLAETSVLTRLSARERRVLARVQENGGDSHVVRLLEPALGFHDGAPFLVLELIDGPSLRERLNERSRLSPREAARIGAGMARGLSAVHAAGGVHRDIKPSNVRLRGGWTPVLVDLGSARALWETQTITQDHRAPMTPRYAAPEQLAGLPAGPASDVYALGLCLFEMLTGQVPLLSESAQNLLALRRAAPPPDPRALRADVPATLARLVLHCLSVDPAQRPSAPGVAATLSAQLDDSAPRRAPFGLAAVTVALALGGPGPKSEAGVLPACTALSGPFLTWSEDERAAPWTFLSFGLDGTPRPPVVVKLPDMDIHVVAQLEHDDWIDLVGWHGDACRRARLRICAEGGARIQLAPACDMPRPHPRTHARLMFGDADGDGRADLAVWPRPPRNAEDEHLMGYTWLGVTSAAPTRVDDAFDFSPLWERTTAPAVRLGDVDGDGHADLVVATFPTGGICPTSVYLLSGDGRGHFTPSRDIPPGAPPGRVAVVPTPGNGGDLGDVDGDGLLDLVLGPDDDGDPGRVWLLRGTGRGFGEAEEALDVVPEVEEGQDGGGSGYVVLDDWNGDGKLDAAVHYDLGHGDREGMAWRVGIYLGDGAGRFVTPAWATALVPLWAFSVPRHR